MKLAQLLNDEVKQNIREAIKDNRIHWLEKNGKTIGFHTWEDEGDRIFINNMWIKEEYRDKDNLLNLRKYFRQMYPSGKSFYWNKRKTGEEKCVR